MAELWRSWTRFCVEYHHRVHQSRDVLALAPSSLVPVTVGRCPIYLWFLAEMIYFCVSLRLH